MKELKFTVFADLHYKKGMYAATTDDISEIFDRAESSDSAFVVHLGDLCNDYLGSPEIVKKCYLNNPQGLPVYGIYGNHELEGSGNSMEVVTPCLTNDCVIWGTKDGKPSPDIAYYHKDIESFRLVFTDTNYSLSPDGVYEHNRTGSWGPPDGNTEINALSCGQLAWLRSLLFDAAERGMKCVVFSHAAFAEKFAYSADAERVRNLFCEVNKVKKGTVVASINGHWHADDYEISDDILYFNVNSAKNGCWLPANEPHYTYEHTCLFYDFDGDGRVTGKRELPLPELWMAPNTWFFDRPLSAIVTLSEDGGVKIEGTNSRWMYDIAPCGPAVSPCRTPHISSVEKGMQI